MCMMHMVMGHGEHGGQAMQEHQAGAPQQESLLDILKRRYALGEINLEQFQEMQRVLGLAGTPPPGAAGYRAHQHNA
jgi:uncharacterized membrane protein